MFGGKDFRQKNGRIVRLLNPAEKSKKYVHELKTGFNHTNRGKPVVDEDGPMSLTREQRSYRAGYLDARKDSAKAYNHNKKKKAEARKSRKKT